MPKALNLTGQKFGLLTALKKAPSRGHKTYWLCQCDCGTQKEIQTSHLISGAISSCGCNKQATFAHKTAQENICPICGENFITYAVNKKYCPNCVPVASSAAESLKWKNRAVKHQLVLYKGGVCQKCGYGKCEGALQFHHLNPEEKEFTISQINFNGTSMTMEKLKQEVDKCILLCANCHAEEHYTEQ